MSNRMRFIFLTITLFYTGFTFACQQEINPEMEDIQVEFKGICTSEDCNRFQTNVIDKREVKEEICLANVTINGEPDVAAIIGTSCKDVPKIFTATTTVQRCYKILPRSIRVKNS